MKINPKILEVLREFGIDEKDGLSYLLSVYFDCRPSYTPPVLTQKINVTRILGLDTTVTPAEVVWRIPLFKTGKDSRVNPKDSKWDWVKPWMEGFKSINSNRYGSRTECIKRLDSFMKKHKDVTIEEIQEATQLYFRNLNSYEYLITSHYFVSKDNFSHLEMWVERYREENQNTPSAEEGNDIYTEMQ